MGESLPVGSVPAGFSIFFISISSWWIHRSGGRRSFWLPFLLPTLWVARFLRSKMRRQIWVPVFNSSYSFFFFFSPQSIQVRSREGNKRAPRRKPWNPGIGRLVLAAFPFVPPEASHLWETWCWIPRVPAACQAVPSSSFPAADLSTRWQWVRWSHMPIFGAGHKVTDGNICLGDKWQSCFKRAKRKKKARMCANSQDGALEESLYLSCPISCAAGKLAICRQKAVRVHS